LKILASFFIAIFLLDLLALPVSSALTEPIIEKQKNIAVGPVPSLTESIASLFDRVEAGSTIAFVEITDSAAGKSSDLTNEMYQVIEHKVVEIGLEKGLHFIERRDLKLILDEWDLDGLSASAGDDGAKSLLGADLILTGKISPSNKSIMCNLKLTKLQNGEIVSVAQGLYKSKIWPANTLSKASQPPAMASSDKSKKLHLWTDKEKYNVGDSMTIFFSVAEPLFVKIFDVTPSGEVTVIFPNPYQQDNYCYPNTTYQIPPKGAAFSIEITPPVGTDRLKGIASASPISNSVSVKTRGIKFTKNIISAAKIRTTHTIIIE
jgi:hypothetical protein